jgi:hypothetical protein
MTLELLVWATIGGLFVTLLSVGMIYYNNDTPSNKQLSRDFLIGAAFTAILYPLIPESFDEIKAVITSTAGDLQTRLPKLAEGSGSIQDPGVQIGPANF